MRVRISLAISSCTTLTRGNAAQLLMLKTYKRDKEGEISSKVLTEVEGIASFESKRSNLCFIQGAGERAIAGPLFDTT